MNSNQMNQTQQQNNFNLNNYIFTLFVSRWSNHSQYLKQFQINQYHSQIFSKNEAIRLKCYTEFKLPTDATSEHLAMLIGANGKYFNYTTQNFQIVGIFKNPNNRYIELFGISGDYKTYGIYAAKKYLKTRLQNIINNN